MNKHTEIWIDTISFSEKGGWKEDTQFVHLMGSGYLMAADDVGVPVKDALTSVRIPEAGRYRIWARTRNWMRQYSPGKFTLLVNGASSGAVLGAMPSDRWVWEIAGDFDLPRGDNTLALHDLTGWFGRCAALLITNDFDYVPPRETGRMQDERARILGLPAGISEGETYDVIVAGGGPGGVPAAVAAARLGEKVLLIHDRPILGGNASGEIGIPSFGAEVAHIHAREGGIAEELMRLSDREAEPVGEWTRAMEKLVYAESNITVLFSSHVSEVEMDGPDMIRNVIVQNTLTLTKARYSAKIFIDCTGDAWLGYYAGAKYHYGREASYEYGESIAPEAADTLTMSGCVRSGGRPYFLDTGEDTPFTLPEWCPKLPEDEAEFGRIISGPRVYWWMEAPNDYNDVYDGEETRDALLLVMLGSWDHMKNHWAKKDTLRTWKMNLSGIINGRRESRRLIGDYVLTQEDCTSGRTFPDVISYSGWALDIHHPRGIYSGKEGPLYSGVGLPIVSVPYRCLYSCNIQNLLFAGRNVSATHIAIGTLRVQLTIMTLGQAAGTAAHLCALYGETPRGIYERHMKELQQLLLKNDQYIPGLRNEDPEDVCLGAEVSASSTSKTELYVKEFGVEGELIELDRCRAAVRGVKKRDIAEIWVKLYSARKEPVPLTLYASMEGDLDTAATPGETYSGQGVVPPMGENWVCFPVTIPAGSGQTGHYLRVWLERCEGIFWRRIEKLSFYRQVGVRKEDGTWDMTRGMSYAVALRKPVEEYADCSPENVVNGYSRIINKEVYEWVSDPKETLPQWLELTPAKPSHINTVSLVFDTDMTNPSTSRDYKYPYVPTCVRDYRVDILTDGIWKEAVSVTDNFMRKRTHRFEAVTAEKVRITVTKTSGDASARIIEVRASNEA
jgi:hypothetical protein